MASASVVFVAAVLWVCGVLTVNGDTPLHVKDKPSMMLFRSFPAISGNIDLAVHISDYELVGRCLLEDDSGAKVSNIQSEEHGRIKNINDEIFKQWLKGSGKRPVTWETFLSCLKVANLNELHSTILTALENGGKSEHVEKEEEQITLPSSGAPMGGSSKKEKVYYIEKGKGAQLLEMHLQEIGDWDSLCTNLEVNEGIMAPLRESTEKPHLKKKACLASYLDSGRPNWNQVVKVVGAFPFYKKGLACKIAEKFMDMDRDHCLDHYLPKDEL